VSHAVVERDACEYIVFGLPNTSVMLLCLKSLVDTMWPTHEQQQEQQAHRGLDSLDRRRN